MQILVIEAVTAGLLGTSPSPTLFREGAAMLETICSDLVSSCRCKTKRCEVSSFWSPHFRSPPILDGVQFAKAHDPLQAWRDSCAAAGRIDSQTMGLVIAPETGGMLTELCAIARKHIELANCTDSALRLASDKLACAEFLHQKKIATIPTFPIDWKSPPAFPCVVKPRDGAGSFLVMRIDSHEDWQQACEAFSRENVAHPVQQQYVVGEHLSIAAIFHTDAQGVCSIRKILPVARQDLADCKRFEYRRSILPAGISADLENAIRQVIENVADLNIGLNGYVGFDIVVDREMIPRIVEINPRLTSSYIAYRGEWANEMIDACFAK